MKTDVKDWLDLATRLGIEVVAPFNLELAGNQLQFTALLPQFGARLGMVVDTDGDVIWPHRTNLAEAGYGFSCVELSGSADLDSAQEMLSDWGWTSASPKPEWLRA